MARRVDIRPLRPNERVGTTTGDEWCASVAVAVGRARQLAHDSIARLYPGAGRGYLLAVLLGDRRLLDERLREALVDTGTYHFLAISGLHVGLLLVLLTRVPLPARFALAMRLSFLGAFAILTGGSAPVLRACLLLSLQLVCERGGRRPRTLNTLGWTALLILAAAPARLAEPGFQLSFAAVAGLCTWGRRLAGGTADDATARAFERHHRRRRTAARLQRAIGGALAISLAATAATSPLSVHYFGRLHPLAPLWNLVAYPFTFLALSLGAASLVVGAVSASAAAPIAAAVELVVQALEATMATAAMVPASTVRPGVVSTAATLGCALALVAPLVLGRRAALVLSALLLLGASLHATTGGPSAELSRVRSRTAEATIVSLAGERGIASRVATRGAGGPAALARAILERQRRPLRAAVLAEPLGAARLASELLREGAAAETWVSHGFLAQAGGAAALAELRHLDLGVESHRIGRGTLLTIGDPGLVVEFLLPPGRETPLTRACRQSPVVVRVRAPDGGVALWADAADRDGLAFLLAAERDLRTEALVVGASAAPAAAVRDLLRRARPELVVVVRSRTHRGAATVRAAIRAGARVAAVERLESFRLRWSAGAGWHLVRD